MPRRNINALAGARAPQGGIPKADTVNEERYEALRMLAQGMGVRFGTGNGRKQR